MSNINYTPIDGNFPIAGQDNDTQGFRTNFTAIKAGLETAKNEITALQANTIDVTHTSTDLAGTTLYNGLYNKFSAVFAPTVQLDSTSPGYLGMTADFDSGPVQQFTVKSDGTVIDFVNWPVNNTPVGASYYSTLRLIIVPIDGSITRNVSFGTSMGGTIVRESTDATLVKDSESGVVSLTLPAAIHSYVLEVWTTDSGQHVHMKTVGIY